MDKEVGEDALELAKRAREDAGDCPCSFHQEKAKLMRTLAETIERMTTKFGSSVSGGESQGVSMVFKLFVWRGVFNDYTAGMAFAIATSTDEARRIIIAAKCQWLWNKKSHDGPPWLIAPDEWAAVTSDDLECHLERGLVDLSAEPEVYECTAPCAGVCLGGG